MALILHNFTVAVDFGTSRSGFAFILKNQDQTKQVNIFRHWPSMTADKTLTQILYDPKGKPISFGYEAPKTYSELQMDLTDEEIKEYSLFKFFKMELRDEKNPTKMLRNEYTGREFPLVKVIADYLVFIRKAIEKTLKADMESMRNVIRWCFTVPAIWTDKEKQLTKEACVLAGFIDDIHVSDEDFMFAPEPEAAAACCMNHLLQTNSLSKGETFLVVDAGGGTIDLTSHVLQYEGKVPKLKSMTKGGGGPWGASELDKNFIKVMEEDVIGKGLMEEMRSNQPMLYFELCYLWENKKLEITTMDSNQTLIVSSEMKDFLINSGYDVSAFFRRGRIFIESNVIRKVYQQVIEEICALVQEEIDFLRKNTKDGKKEFHNIFLVGGFGESQVLQDAINQRFGSNFCKVTCPQNAGASIVNGAVMLGIDPSLIMTRRMRRAYGMKVSTPFNPKIHTAGKSNNIAGSEYAFIFDPFVNIDQEVKFDQIVTREYYPLYESQTAMRLELFTSYNERTLHIDEPGTHKSGEITIDMSGTSGLYRIIEVSMSFGKSELEVVAHDKTSGKKYVASLDFTQNTFVNKID